MQDLRPDPKRVVEQAEQEIREENFRSAVEQHKAYLREYRSLWDRIFPWKITIERK